MTGHCEIPTPLTLTNRIKYRFHFYLGCTAIPCGLCLYVGFSQLLFQSVTYFQTFLLTLIDILSKYLFTLAVTLLTRAVDMGQRALYVVVRELYTSIRRIGHMAVGTTHATLAVNTEL